MGDAAGETAQRFQALRLTQRGFGGLAAIGFGVQVPRALNGEAEQREHQEARRYAEDQMAADARQPFIADFGRA